MTKRLAMTGLEPASPGGSRTGNLSIESQTHSHLCNEPLYQLSYMAGERSAMEKTSSVIGFQHVCLFCSPYGDETTSATYHNSLPLCFATIPSSKLDCFHFSWRYMTTFTFPGNIWPLSLSSETPTYPSPTPLMASLPKFWVQTI